MQQHNDQPDESITMSPEEEQEYMNRVDHEVDSAEEPADEGVGAMTDNQDIDPATEN